MTKTLKPFGIIVMITVMAFSVIACDEDNGDNNSEDTKSDWKGDQNGNGTLTFSLLSDDPDSTVHWEAKINENWLFDGYQIQAGDKFKLTYAFTSNYEIGYFWSSIIDTTKEANWWTSLTSGDNYKYDLTQGTTHAGSIEYVAQTSAMNNSSDASVLYFWVKTEETQKGPLIWNFTKLEIEKIEAE